MPIEFACSCGRPIKAADEHAGRRGRRPQCRAVVTIPIPVADDDLLTDWAGLADSDPDAPMVPPSKASPAADRAADDDGAGPAGDVAPRVFYRGRHYLVTDRMLSFGHQTHAVAHLVSLTRGQVAPNPLPALLLYGLAMALLLGGVAALFIEPLAGLGILVGGAVVFYAGVAAMRSLKPVHTLTLVFSSAERFHPANGDAGYIDRIAEAVRRALEDLHGRVR